MVVLQLERFFMYHIVILYLIIYEWIHIHMYPHNVRLPNSIAFWLITTVKHYSRITNQIGLIITLRLFLLYPRVGGDFI